MKSYLSNDKGLTMVEVIVALSVTTLIVMTAFSIMNFANLGWKNEETKVDQRQDIRLVLNNVTQKINTATSSKDVYLNNSSSFTVYVKEFNTDKKYTFSYENNKIMQEVKVIPSGNTAKDPITNEQIGSFLVKNGSRPNVYYIKITGKDPSVYDQSYATVRNTR